MKPINENEFMVREAQIARKHQGLRFLVKSCLAALKQLVRTGNDPIHLPHRLLRDAGIDELEIERKRLASAPLVR